MRNPSAENPSKRLVSARAAAVAPFLAMDVLAAAKAKERQGGDVIHMEVGQPSAPAPRRALEAARAALVHGQIGYTEALGLPQLRERIARHYRDTYGIAVAAERVVVTTGSSAGFILAFLALFELGARVAITAPGYPAYRNILGALGIEAVPIPTGEQDRWAMTGTEVDQLHRAAPLQGVLAMSPANPTGTMMTRAALADVAEVARRHGLWLISDEIYHGLTYDEPAATALAFDASAIVVNSFSKYYCMTGWRIGWLVVPPELVRQVERLAQNLYISAPFLSQVAAEAAFEAVDELEAVKAGYAKNRNLLLEELPHLGFATAPVDGAFYVYADASRFTNDSLAFCKRLLAETGVAATPGLDFDAERGHRFVRLCFAGSNDACAEAMRRLRSFLHRT
jgi:aspartate/methionine/tyrosine aminotransferase